MVEIITPIQLLYLLLKYYILINVHVALDIQNSNIYYRSPIITNGKYNLRQHNSCSIGIFRCLE